MLIPLDQLIKNHNLDISGVLHLGAHTGEEAAAYHANHVGAVYWVEGNPDLMKPLTRHLAKYPNQTAHHGLLADVTGKEMVFHISSNDTTPAGKIDHQSSSLLQLGTHLKSSPDVYFGKDITLTSTTVDDLVEREGIGSFNFMNLDLQGAELLALLGADKALRASNALYTEVNEREVYVGCVKIKELDRFLAQYGFTRRQTEWAGKAGWGDALYVKGV